MIIDKILDSINNIETDRFTASRLYCLEMYFQYVGVILNIFNIYKYLNLDSYPILLTLIKFHHVVLIDSNLKLTLASCN